ncbi:hypothetical protein COW36_02360 [bacterium (Candidatus Blackallbacteria) CG17_big_fil_post_rev_8_21_14_2_50_48_46]|uniref:Uncharacterized protein n=1 Tax=bacterium (Candidatus Blackallbacteria) CG17_big_fil_post_rev_8_21_14_2_50_48_46 TaxID=2014261 RepID=A0A2M7GA00_9BACT|nr:MAG: hypothetical protein COW64_13110 [bacterium (Candidatus Blackallbacteria) CG18_big_fil_WC_8_21_14_2_50_49_26]PIW18972.1 MAG: hypothetical protein COW36_02360 [bacterium (Candidatus Blackallbacteria) CG17_big_fil_post_rev_8_21_14_2_50_48_46]PIW44660.1 MAG: hypothetical protein COW20_23755 [bacterium (Candidatus Blackallbacteria) CG13_big_fil_rev_8_21_14_2_50_49_14]
MAVPVVIGKSTFDYAPLRQEQSRLSKTMVIPSPRDKDDTAQTLEVVDNQATPFKYPTFIKTFFDKPGQLPRFELWMKDNFDQEYNLAQGAASIGINDDPLVAGFTAQSNVAANYVISPVTGEIRLGGTLNATTGLVTGGTLVGTVKFDGVTGLALAAINTRIADVSNAVEGMTKILSVVSGNLDTTLNLIK